MATKLDKLLSNKTYVLTEMYERLSPQKSMASSYVTVGKSEGMTSSLSDLVGSNVLAQLKEKLPNKTKGYLLN